MGGCKLIDCALMFERNLPKNREVYVFPETNNRTHCNGSSKSLRLALLIEEDWRRDFAVPIRFSLLTPVTSRKSAKSVKYTENLAISPLCDPHDSVCARNTDESKFLWVCYVKQLLGGKPKQVRDSSTLVLEGRTGNAMIRDLG